MKIRGLLFASALLAGSPAYADVVFQQANGQWAIFETNLAGTVNTLVVDANIVSGGGTGGTASDFGAAFPASGTAAGMSDGTNMVPLKTTDGVTLDINCVVGCAGGTFNNNADNVATSSTNGQAAAWLYGWDGSAWDRVPATALDGLLVNLGSNNDVTVTSGAVTVTGNVANDAPDSGNPVKVGGVALSTLPTLTAGDRGDLSLGVNSTLMVNSGVQSSGADGVVNSTLFGFRSHADSIGTGRVAMAAGFAFNGTTWDRVRGDATNGTLVNLGANNDVTVTGTVTVTDGAGALNTIVDSGTLTAVTSITNALPAGTNNIGDVDVASSALPTGAATAAKQPALGTAGTASTDVLTVQGIAAMTPLNVAIVSGGGTGGTASDFSAAFPASGTAAGMTDGTNMVPLVTTDGTSLDVNCVVGCAGGTFNNNADNVATSATNGQSAAWLYGWDGATWDRVPANSTDGVLVDLGANNDVSILDALPAGANNIGDVDIAGALPAGTNNIGDVDIASGTLTAVTTITNPVTVTDGTGAMNVIVDSGTITAVTAISNALPAGNNNIGDVDVASFPDNEPINVAQINGVAVTMGNGASGTGVQRVTLADNSTGNIATIGTSVTPGTAAANLGKAEDAAHTTGDVGVMALALRRDSPTATGADNDYIPVTTDSGGRAWISGTGVLDVAIPPNANLSGFAGDIGAAAGTAGLHDEIKCTDSVAIDTASSGNVELVALTASEQIFVCGYDFIASGAVAVQMIYGTGTACATGETNLTGAYSLAANGGIVKQMPNGNAMKAAVSNALCIELSGAVQVSGSVQYTKF